MGQLFILAPVPTGMRCTCSDYGAAGMANTRYTALISHLRIQADTKFPRHF